MKLFRSLFWLFTGLVGGAGATAWLMQKGQAPAKPSGAPVAPPPPLAAGARSVPPAAVGRAPTPVSAPGASVSAPPAAPSTTIPAASSPASPVASPAAQPGEPLVVANETAQPPMAPSATPPAEAANVEELQQWKTLARGVQGELKEMESSLTTLRDELAAVQGWQARTPNLVRLGQSLAKLPAPKAKAADAAIAAGRFPAVSAGCQDLSSIVGIGEIFEQRLYEAGIGTFWEVANLSEAEFRQIVRVTGWQQGSIDFEGIQVQALRFAQEGNTVGLLWEGDQPDDLARIKGIGKVFEQKLYDGGIRTYRALAAATEEDLAAILGSQVVHPQLSQWIRQAEALAAGGPKG
jgi:predicted flap endonuclease-1-like 5' DNA nuclease